MAEVRRKKSTIAILTGGGDVPGLNPAIRAITIRALREGYQVLGLRSGWAGIMELIRDKKADNTDKYMILTEEIVNKVRQDRRHFSAYLEDQAQPCSQRTMFRHI